MYKYTIEDMQKFASRRGGQCLSAKYEGNKTKLWWQCEDGHRWQATPSNIIYNHRWCPHCAKRKHFTEEKCRYILEQATGLKFPPNRVVLGGGFELDLYNCEYKIGVEYNGIQHYKFVKGWHKTIDGFNKSQERDQIKRERCEELGIDLHVVSYRDSRSDEKLIAVLFNIIQSCELPIVTTAVDLSDFYKKLSSLSDLKYLASQHKGKCLSKEYINCETKCKFQCQKGHVFEMEPRHVKANHWCPECSYVEIGNKNRKLTLQDAQQAAIKKGGKCLSKSYKSSSTKMKWKCAEGHMWEAPFNYIRSGYWCKFCGYQDASVKLRSSLESIQQVAESRGGRCLSDNYVNGRTKLEFECKDGHRWWARPDNIKSGKWCLKCKYIRLGKDHGFGSQKNS